MTRPRELSTDQKGAIAESAVVHAAIELGIEVYLPAVDGGRYDMILAVGNRLERVQCKWAPLFGGQIVLRCYSARRCSDGLIERRYTADEIDAFAAYAPDIDRCFYLPMSWVGHRVSVFVANRAHAKRATPRRELGG